MARKFFFSQLIRSKLVDWLPPQYQEAMRLLLTRTAVLLRLMDSDQRVDIDKVRDLCTSSYILIHDNFGKIN